MKSPAYVEHAPKSLKKLMENDEGVKEFVRQLSLAEKNNVCSENKSRSLASPTIVPKHTWLNENRSTTDGVVTITSEGLEHISNHKYKSGDYTHLDELCNPMWTYLTNLLPLWLAPNMVTTMGGLQCALSYTILCYYSPNFDKVVPDWTLVVSALCTSGYYTFDCMDGKQSRRTGTSSPLGQLFDHGFDCICLLSHIAVFSGYVMIGASPWYLILQTTLQLSFFCAQWEEYYTHVLPHACGKWLGVTEVNYGIAMLAFINAFVDREAFWKQNVASILPSSFSSPLIDSIVQKHDFLQDLEVRYAAVLLSVSILVFLIFLSTIRVYHHVQSFPQFLSALTKFISPLILTITILTLPSYYIQHHTREISISVGLAFSFITNKMIVYSMAKMAFASIQVHVVFPWMCFCIWVHYDTNLTHVGGMLCLRAMCIWYVFVLLCWCKGTIDAICKKLDIFCFTIKKKKKE